MSLLNADSDSAGAVVDGGLFLADVLGMGVFLSSGLASATGFGGVVGCGEGAAVCGGLRFTGMMIICFPALLMTMGDSFLRATGETNIIEDLRDYCAHFAEKMEISK